MPAPAIPFVRGVVVAAALLLLPSPPPASARQDAPPEPRTIDIVARRFAFEPSEIQVTAGEAVRLSVRSADGLHGFEIKALKVKKEIPRGAEPVVIEFTAAAPGRFAILCSEFCGKGHDDMKGTLVVLARDAAQGQ